MDAVPEHGLQERIRKHVRDWSVEIEHSEETGTSVLLFGHRNSRPVVLKVLRHPGDEWLSGAVLAAFEGRGAARVYEYAEGALLLERLRPGTSLAQLALAGQDDEATGILVDVIGAMTPGSAPPTTPTLLDWGQAFDRYAAAGDARIPRELVAEAQEVYARLCRSQTQVRLLHGDLQHYNVLSDADRGWLAIDPKGVVGETEFEIGAAMRNPCEGTDAFARPEVVERRLNRFASRLPIDRGRALSWAFAQAILSEVWRVEDGDLAGEPHGLLLARVVRPMLG